MKKYALIGLLAAGTVAAAIAISMHSASVPATEPPQALAVTDVKPTANSEKASAFPQPVVAVVDIEKIMRESVASKSVRDQLASKRDSYQKEIATEEKKLEEAYTKLSADRKKLTEQEFSDKRKAFEDQAKKVQQNVNDRARSLDIAFSTAMNEIKQAAGQVVADAAAARGINIVVDKAQVVVVETSLDLTAETMEQLNKKLSKVDVKIPAPGASTASAPKSK